MSVQAIDHLLEATIKSIAERSWRPVHEQHAPYRFGLGLSLSKARRCGNVVHNQVGASYDGEGYDDFLGAVVFHN